MKTRGFFAQQSLCKRMTKIKHTCAPPKNPLPLSKPNEAPRSKLRGITQLNSEDFSEAEAKPVANYGECSGSFG